MSWSALPPFIALVCLFAWANKGRLVDWINYLQWPAMLCTLFAAWLVASSQQRRRNVGFWVFLASNALWVAWGIHDGAIALIVLQVGLALMNLRGAAKTEPV
jgi:chromate transport protein ChrA